MAHQRNTHAVAARYTQDARPAYREGRASTTTGRRTLRADKPYMSPGTAAFVERSLSAYERAPKDERLLPREL
jgi:hypothetical protein